MIARCEYGNHVAFNRPIEECSECALLDAMDRPTHDAQGRALHYWDADGEFIGPEGLTTQQCCERGIRL